MSQTIVIFGASGDLTSRKLIPALYELYRKGRLPQRTRIIGFARSEFTHHQWRESLAGTTSQFVGSQFSREVWDTFAESIFWFTGNINSEESFRNLNCFITGNVSIVKDSENGSGIGSENGNSESGNTESSNSESGSSVSAEHPGSPESVIYYLAVSPDYYVPAIENLGRTGMADQSLGSRRIVIEKPFGTDYNSSAALNQTLHEVFDESQVYRIDHYLGKETVANIMVLRFANTIFEPIWNRNYIDNIQITAAESVKVGRRAGYYEHSGVLRDMFQNHLLQLMILTAMEAPAQFDADVVRDEKVKVLRSIRPMTPGEAIRRSVRGQYRSYRDEPGVSPDSRTATFGAVRLEIDNWRWKSVPFYLRSGKVMSCQTTQIVIEFRQPPHFLFESLGIQGLGMQGRGTQGYGPQGLAPRPNRLVLQIQPAEGIRLYFETKIPDQGMAMRQSTLDFDFQQGLQMKLPDSYQRLLLDVMQGDASLFARTDEVELAWNIIDPIQRAWDEDYTEPDFYEEGQWGPAQSNRWMAEQGHQWFDVCPILEH